MRRVLLAWASLVLSLMLSGCLYDYYMNEGNGITFNRALVHNQRMHLVDKKGKAYQLIVTHVDSGRVFGLGKVKDSLGTTLKKGQLSLAMDSIDYLISKKRNGFWAVVSLVTIYNSSLLFEGLTQPAISMAETRREKVIPSGSSCPYGYVRDSSGTLRLFGEFFGTGIGRALEVESRFVVPLQKNNRYHLLMRNERPETHYVNRMQLRRLSPEAGYDVAVSFDDRYFQYHGARNVYTPPRSASSDPGRRLRDFKDEWLFPIQTGARNGLMVRARNSYLSNAVMDDLFGALGEQSWRFFRAIEHDPYWIKQMKTWRERVMLRVAYHTPQQGWVTAGSIRPEATEFDFSRMVILPAAADSVRLSSLADVWHIRSVDLLENVMPCPGAVIPPTDSQPADVRFKDGAYALLMPGDSLKTGPVQLKNGERLALEVSGYLYPWFRRPEGIAASLHGDRLKAFGTILEHPDLYLEALYARWERHPLYLER